MRRAVQAIIVLLLLAVVGGLFGVFIRNARITAARTQCINNLKFLGLAVQNYHDTYKRFPSATVPSPDLPPEQRLSLADRDLAGVHVRRHHDPVRHEAAVGRRGKQSATMSCP